MNADFKICGLEIETERLILRPFREGDLADLYEYASVEGVGEMAGWAHHKSIDESRKILEGFIEEDKTFAIVHKDGGRVIGSLGVEKYGLEDKLSEFDGYLGREIGYVLSKDHWGGGLMTEAVRAVIDHLFFTLGYDFLLCGYYLDNERSKRVQEKCGFVPYRRLAMNTQLGTTEAGVLNLLINPMKDIRLDFSHPETLIYSKLTENEQIAALVGKYSDGIADLYGRLRRLIFLSAPTAPVEMTWARLPSYYVGEKFVRLIPFGDHINIEAAPILAHKAALSGYKISPKGMLQIFVGQELPTEVLRTIFKEAFGE